MSKRTLQVSEAIREHLALMLVRGEINDPRVRNVTINSVKVSPDLQLARVYYSVLGSEQVRRDVGHGLKNAAGFMRKSLGEALKMRYTPVLAFHYDESIERAARMGELFAGIERERRQYTSAALNGESAEGAGVQAGSGASADDGESDDERDATAALESRSDDDDEVAPLRSAPTVGPIPR